MAEDLFEAGAQLPAKADGRGGVRAGSGRKPGSLNRVNLDLRSLLVNLTGREAIIEQYRIASTKVDDEAELDRLAALWKCDRLAVVDRVGKSFERVAGHVYPKLGSLELRKPGAPGNPIEADDLFSISTDYTDVTPSDAEETE